MRTGIYYSYSKKKLSKGDLSSPSILMKSRNRGLGLRYYFNESFKVLSDCEFGQKSTFELPLEFILKQ